MILMYMEFLFEAFEHLGYVCKTINMKMSSFVNFVPSASPLTSNFAAKAKKLMLQYDLRYSDLYYNLQIAIQNTRDQKNHIERVRAFSDDTVYTYTEYYDVCMTLQRLVRQFKDEKWLCIRIMIEIDNIIEKHPNTSIHIIEQIIRNNKLCKLRYYWVTKIFDKFSIKLIKIEERNILLRKIRLDKIRFMKENRHNYNLLDIEDLDLEDENFSDWEYNQTVNNYDLEVKYRPSWYNIVNSFNESWKDEPKYQPSDPIYRNSFLLFKIRSVIEAFRRFRMPTFGIPKYIFMQSNSSQNIRHEWTAIYRPTTRVLEGDSNIEMQDLGQIDFAEDALDTMPEDNKQQVYPEDYVVFCKSTSTVRPQCEMMDEPHGDCEELVQEQQENVILTTHTEEPSKTQPITVKPGIWEDLCSPQQVAEYTQLMSRWQRIKTVVWSKDDVVHTNLFKDTQNGLILPKSYITNPKLVDSPSCVLFKTYAYFRSDIEIKIVVNTNKFHCGQLQASFYYGASLDKYYADRSNVFSASQLPHVIIDAASASDAILKIPYRHYKPLMATSSRSDDNVVLDLGVLRLMVLNQLSPPKDEDPHIDISIFMRFVKPSFHGMKPRDIGVINEMMGMAALVKETANLVQQIYPDNQRDNPTDVVPPKPMVPWSAHSWCIGDVCPEPTNPLRLQATGNTPHLPGTIPYEPEMTLKYVQEIYGLISRTSWNNSQPEGTILCRMPFSPVLDTYPTVSLSNPTKRSCDIMPPLSVLANLFAYWRGSIEYRLDFVATQFHTGRLIIAYLPRVVLNGDPTIEQLSFCDHVVVDLRDGREVNYINSFLADKPWYPRRAYNNFSTEVHPPGYIYIAVLTQLTATKSVNDSVMFNMYMRGGRDFELHIPVSSSIGLSFNTDVVESVGSTISYLSNYGPPYTSMYIGIWHTTGKGLLLRYGPGSDHITQFNIANAGKIFVLTDTSRKLRHPVANTNFNYLVVFTISGYAYGAVFLNFNASRAFLNTLNTGEFDPATSMDTMTQNGDKPDGDYVDESSTWYWKPTSALDDWVIAEAGDDQRKDDCGMNVDVQRPLRSTRAGLLTFGEQVYSIKQLTRRYMYYGEYTQLTSKSSNYQLADVGIPILPQGLDLSPKTSSNVEQLYDNRIRDGPIPILASGYRFFRGSVRLRLVISGRMNGSVWLQHRPEYNLRSMKIFKPDSNYVEAYYQPGYASLIQFTQMNNVVEVEIPFYLPGQFGMLQRPNLTTVEDAVHYSLGVLYVGFDTMTNAVQDTPFNIRVYYSMGDDMTFSVFQGFPPMFSLTQFNKPVIQSEGVGDRFKKYVSSAMKSSVIEVIKDAVEVKNNPIPEPSISTPSETPILTSSTTTEDATIVEMVTKLFPELTAEKKMMLVSILGNLIHCAINPKVSTIAWSIANMLVIGGVMCISFVEKICNALKRLLQSMLRTSKKSEQGANVIESQGPNPHLNEQSANEAAFVSTCIAGILALAGATSKPIPKKVPDFARYLYEGMPKFSLTANGIFIFLTNNINMFKKIWFWLVSKWDSNYILYTELAGAPDKAIEFVKQIQFVIDARNNLKVRTDPACTVKVYELANKAQYYLARRAVSDMGKAMPLLEMYCKKVIKLRDELSTEFLSPAIRFEPFVISFNGPSNVGKSHLASRVGEQMLTAISYKTYNNLVYTRTPGNQYWNGLNNQPICLYDDFLNITDSQHSLTQLGELYCLKSKAVFNPPMAAIEEKKLRYNPLIVLLCNNKAFPKIDGLAMEEAWMRRRDLLIEVRKIPKYKAIHPRDLPYKVKQVYGHLRFSFYKNPAGMTAEERELEIPFNEALDGWMTFEELNAAVGKRFLHYFEEECNQYDEAITRLKAFHPIFDETTEEYCMRIQKEVADINDGRISTKEKDLIDKLLMDLHTNKYTADLSKFVTKSIVEKKKKEFEVEVKHEKQINKKKEALAKVKVTIEQLKKELLNLNESMLKATSIEEKDRIGDSMVKVQKSLVDSETSARQLEKDKDIIESQGPSVNVTFDDDRLKSHYLSLPEETREEVDPALFASVIMNVCEYNLACVCAQRIGFLKSFQTDSVKRKVIIELDYGVVIPARFAKQKGVILWDIVFCSEQCDLLKSKYIDKLLKFQHGIKLADIQRDYLPPQWQTYIQQSQRPDNITLMTSQEVDDHLKAEILDKTWYERLWEKVPKFGTIFKWLVKLGALILAVGSVVRVAGYFMGSKDSAEASVIKSKCEKKYWENNLLLEETLAANIAPKEMLSLTDVLSPKEEQATSDVTEIKATKVNPSEILSLTDVLSPKEEQATGYATGTIAAKVNPSVPIKAFQNASEQQELVISSKIKNNTFWLLAKYDNGVNGERSCRSYRCLGLVERKFIVLDHYLFFFQQCQNLELFFVKNNMSVALPLEVVTNVAKMQNSAICIGNLTRQCPQFKNIVNLFAPSSYTKNMCPSATLYEPCLNVDNGEFVMKEHYFARISLKHRIDVSNDDGSTTIVSAAYSYEYSGRGVCGSVLVTNANYPSPIIGIHIAGMTKGGEGFAEAIVFESLKPLLQDVTILNESTCVEVSEEKSPRLGLNGNIELYGVVPKKLACMPPAETRLINTVCAGKITDITYDTPVLSPNDERIQDAPFSPLLEGCKYHVTPCLPMESSFVNVAIEDVTNMLLANVKPQRMNVGRLSVEQAVCGIPGNVLYEAMAMDTSEGFPWIKDRPAGCSNKSWMFTREETSEGWKLLDIYKPLSDALVEKEESRRNKQYCQTIFVDTLKDAKLPKEKVLIPGKTRIFSVSPVDFTIMLRQYTTDFVVGYTQARLKAEHAIGIDIVSVEANYLVEHMMSYGNNMICGDYSKFGDQLYAVIVFAVYKMIWKWYELNGVDDECFQNVLDCFAEETAQAYHLMIDLIYKSLGGMPSGNPLTVVINSIVNSCYVRVVWQSIMFEMNVHYMSMDIMHANIKIVTYGDDLWITVKDAFRDIFNASSMAEAFSKYNIKFTNASKGSEIVSYAPLLSPEVTFLKRTFRKHPWRNYWMSCMEKRVVEETCNWTWKTHKDVEESSVEACRQMMELAYGHGPDYYSELRQKVLTFWNKYGKFLSIPTWEQMDMRIYDT